MPNTFYCPQEIDGRLLAFDHIDRLKEISKGLRRFFSLRPVDPSHFKAAVSLLKLYNKLCVFVDRNRSKHQLHATGIIMISNIKNTKNKVH